MARMLSSDEKKYFMGVKYEDMTSEFFQSHFMDVYDKKAGKVKPAKYKSSMEFYLDAGEYHNKQKILTNVGLYLFNKFLFGEFIEVLGYQNIPFDNSVVKKIDKRLSELLLTDKITAEQMGNYLNRFQWLVMNIHSMISGSFTMKSVKPVPAVMKKREELLKKNREAIDKGDIIVSASIEKELLEEAAKDLKGDDGMLLYESGARGSFGNNFKNISVMKGAVPNPIDGSVNIVETNFMEGIRKKDIAPMANSVVAAAYPKAIGTAESGYFSKKIIAAMQAVVLDERGSDCKTKSHLDFVIDPSQKSDYLYRYIIEGDKLLMLIPDNIDKYVGKVIKLRSPLYCATKKICNKCGGELNYMLGVTNLGLTASRVSSTLLNLGMKKFHDTRSRVIMIDPKRITI